MRPAVFLERRSYRRRRMMDALRILPVVGVLLWMFPLFWPTKSESTEATGPMAMSDAVFYVFLVWVLLIAASYALYLALRPGDDPPEGSPPEDA